MEEVRTYTNKVDIWTLGCILYELVFCAKAFPNDLAVWNFSQSVSGRKSLKHLFYLDIIPDKTQGAFVHTVIFEMLQVDPIKRPDASNLVKRFQDIAEQATSPRHSFGEVVRDDLIHWWIGHIVVVVSSILYFLCCVSFNSKSAIAMICYHLALLSAMFSYGLLVQNKSFRVVASLVYLII
jgi:serine/threonine protein kinase